MGPGWEERVAINVQNNVVQSVSWTEDDGRIIDYFMTFAGHWIWGERYSNKRGVLAASDASDFPAIWLLKKEMSENESLTLKLWPTQWEDPTERVTV